MVVIDSTSASSMRHLDVARPLPSGQFLRWQMEFDTIVAVIVGYQSFF